jgi:hypothetical protein
MNVDLQPLYVRMDIKGKITQLTFEEEIMVERSSLQRSSTTGSLKLICPKARINEIETRNMKYAKLKEERAKEKALLDLEKEQNEKSQLLEEKLKKLEVSKEEKKVDLKGGKWDLKEHKIEASDAELIKNNEIDVDEDDLPPPLL